MYSVGIEEINVDINGDVSYEIYNINGVKAGSNSFDALVPGLYIVREGSAVKKIVVK